MNHFPELREGTPIYMGEFMALLELPGWSHKTELVEIIPTHVDQQAEHSNRAVTAKVVVKSKNPDIKCHKQDGTTDCFTIQAAFTVVTDGFKALSCEPSDHEGGLVFNLDLDVSLDRQIYAPLDFGAGHRMQKIDKFFPRLFLTPNLCSLRNSCE